MSGPGPVAGLDVSFLCDADIAEYVFVTVGASASSVKVPTSAAESYKVLGITQYKGKSGQAVTVRMAGTSRLVANETMATVGTNVYAQYTTAADRGKGSVLALPTKPSAASSAYVKSEADGALTYAEDIQNWVRIGKAITLEAAGAQGDLIRVLIAQKSF